MGHWKYETKTTERGVRRIVRLDSMLPIAVGGGKHLGPVQLRFTDDPVSGYECSLQLSGGNFRDSSAVATRVDWRVDEGEAVRVLASHPDATPPRLSLRDPRHRWFELRGARMLAVSFRGDDYRRHKAVFDIGDLDRGSLDWDQQRYAEQYWQAQEQDAAPATVVALK